MKKKGLVLSVAAVLLLSLPALAVWDMSDAFAPASGSATTTVHSWVESLVTAQMYRYYYQIDSTSVNINWFSVGLLTDQGLGGYGTTPTTLGQVPLMWAFMDVTSISGLFGPQITPNGKSCILYFDSVNAPVVGEAIVGGNTNTRFHSLTGDVFTPIPEPCTLGLLALGMGLIARKK